MRRKRLMLVATAFVLGGVSVFSFAPIGAFFIAPFTLGGLYLLLTRSVALGAKAWMGAFISGAFGLGLFLGGVSWVYVSLSRFGGLHPLPASLASFLFCSVLALFPALVGAVFCRVYPRCFGLHPFFFAGLWTLSEWLRGWVFTGFPWLSVGYSQTPPSVLAGYAPFVGVYGVSFMLVLIGALLATALSHLRAHRQRAIFSSAIALILLMLGGLLNTITLTHPQGTPFRVSLLQGNIPQALKWRPEEIQTSMQIYHDLAKDHPAALIVMPETALPLLLEYVPKNYLDALTTLAKQNEGNILLGLPERIGKPYHNIVLSLGQNETQRYAKKHLVPFGEYIPPGFQWFMDLLSIPLAGFTPGAPAQPPLMLGTTPVAINICYEDAFGEEIITALPEAQLLINVSNVAWFGDSLAPAQHLQIAQMRALESGRMMLRATNTGMTAMINHKGVVISVLPAFTRGALTGEATPYIGATPYVLFGNLPIVLLSCGLVFFGIALSRQRKAYGTIETS